MFETDLGERVPRIESLLGRQRDRVGRAPARGDETLRERAPQGRRVHLQRLGDGGRQLWGWGAGERYDVGEGDKGRLQQLRDGLKLRVVKIGDFGISGIEISEVKHCAKELEDGALRLAAQPAQL